MIHLDKDNFEKEVLKSNMPVLVDYYAEWCGPCKMLGPIFEKVSKEFPKIKFAKLNVQDNQDLASKHDVMGIPCMIFFDKGKEKGRITGYMPEEKLREKIKELI
jgi:thioredoxin 1